MEVNTVEITPQFAQHLLDNKSTNRSVSRQTVDGYANDMTRGLWAMNGATIVLDENGRLIDGQHRLSACVQSGVSFKTLVVKTSSGAMLTIDTGRKRTVGDALTIGGMKNGNQIAAAARMLHAVFSNHDGAKISTTRTLDIISAFPSLEQSERARNAAFNAHLAPSAVMVLETILISSGEDPLKISQALETLNVREPQYKGDAIHAAREYIIIDRLRNARKMPSISQLRVLLYAWKNFAKDQPRVKFIQPMATELTDRQRKGLSKLGDI